MPAFGNNTLYPTYYVWNYNCMYMTEFPCPENGFLTKVFLGLGSPLGVMRCRAVVYDANGNLMATSNEVSVTSGTTIAWYEFLFPSTPITAGQLIWLGVYADSANSVLFGTDTGATPGAFRVYYTVGDVVPVSVSGLLGASLPWTQSAYAEYATTPGIPQWNLMLSVNPVEGGTISSSALSGDVGLSPIITATPNPNYVLTSWVVDSIPHTPSGNSITLDGLTEGTHTVEAVFTYQAVTQYTLTIQSIPSGIPFTIT